MSSCRLYPHCICEQLAWAHMPIPERAHSLYNANRQSRWKWDENPFNLYFLWGTWEFNCKSYFYVCYVVTHSILSETSQFDGNISGGKMCILFLMQSLEYLHENLSPIGWKPSYCWSFCHCGGHTQLIAMSSVIFFSSLTLYFRVFFGVLPVFHFSPYCFGR